MITYFHSIIYPQYRPVWRDSFYRKVVHLIQLHRLSSSCALHAAILIKMSQPWQAWHSVNRILTAFWWFWSLSENAEIVKICFAKEWDNSNASLIWWFSHRNKKHDSFQSPFSNFSGGKYVSGNLRSSQPASCTGWRKSDMLCLRRSHPAPLAQAPPWLPLPSEMEMNLTLWWCSSYSSCSIDALYSRLKDNSVHAGTACIPLEGGIAWFSNYLRQAKGTFAPGIALTWWTPSLHRDLSCVRPVLGLRMTILWSLMI